MSCNGYGHPPECNCGWGGVFHGVSQQLHWGAHNSYTTPNAKCPECGSSVFFYRNSTGSRVYFDSLGPPWPVHPCFDEYQKSKDRAAKSSEWWPIKVHWLEKAGNNAALMGISPESHVFLKVITNFKKLDVNAPWFCRIISDEFDEFECSTLVLNRKGEVVVRNIDGFGLRAFSKRSIRDKYSLLYETHLNRLRQFNIVT